MDGIEETRKFVVVAATNRPNVVDPALRRPGRFDREVEIPAPDADERALILSHYFARLPVDQETVSAKKVARECVGYVGADLEALCREAAAIAFAETQHSLFASSHARAVGSAAERKEEREPALIKGQHFATAMLAISPSSQRGFQIDMKRVAWDDIGGLATVKKRLKQAVEWPLLHSETMARVGLTPPRGILLYGPPGCSKTTLVRAIASSSSSSFFSLSGASVFSSYVGEAERTVRNLFRRARSNRPCVLFFDEFDSLVGSRSFKVGDTGNAHGQEGRLLSTFLTEMDGVSSSSGVLVVAATNRADLLDPALLRPGRFDFILNVRTPCFAVVSLFASLSLSLSPFLFPSLPPISLCFFCSSLVPLQSRPHQVPPPDLDARIQILQVKTAGMPISPDVDVKELATRMELYSGADIESVCREAAMQALREDVRSLVVVSVCNTFDILSEAHSRGREWQGEREGGEEEEEGSNVTDRFYLHSVCRLTLFHHRPCVTSRAPSPAFLLRCPRRSLPTRAASHTASRPTLITLTPTPHLFSYTCKIITLFVQRLKDTLRLRMTRCRGERERERDK